MSKTAALVAACLTATVGTLLAAPAATANTTVCTGTLDAVTVDHIVVPSGASCTLNGTQVSGGITVEAGATLRGNINTYIVGSIVVQQDAVFTIDKAVIEGDVICASCMRIGLHDTGVDGSVQIVGAGGGDLASYVNG